MKVNQLDSKYLRSERFEKIGSLTFQKWFFLYFLNSNNVIIKTTFYKGKELSTIMKKNRIKETNIYDELFKKYFNTGEFSHLPEIDISSFPEKYQKVYYYMIKNRDKIFYYGELAELCKIKNGARFIGYLMKINPIPIIIPCHHVLGKNNPYLFSLGGDLKKELLILEKKDVNRHNII